MDLKPFFEGAQDYVVLKLPDHFPDYADGSDLDVLCKNRLGFLRHILRQAKSLQQSGFKLQLHIERDHWHVDFYAPGSTHLNFRFDLMDSLADFERFSISAAFEKGVLDGRREVVRNGVRVLVPRVSDDLAIRCLEYLAWREVRPEKAKHWRYIEQLGDWSFIEVINRHTNLKLSTRTWWFRRTMLRVGRKSQKTQNIPSAPPMPFYQPPQTCRIPHLDEIYRFFFGETSHGIFVEIGNLEKRHPGSNTRCLADLGWKGVYPIKPALQTEGQNCERAEVFSARNSTLADCLGEKGVPQNFELLSLDAGAFEWAVFDNFEIESWRPQMVIIQLRNQNGKQPPEIDPNLKTCRYFDDHQYTPVFKDDVNTVYVCHKRFSDQRPQLDYFLIWGHGVQHTSEILNILRARQGFEIVAIHKKTIADMANFVQQVYACDFVPLHHLTAKTRYLLQTPSEIVLVLARNLQPQEQFYGEEPFRHIQCRRVKEIKEEIRNRFNPRTDGKRSEDHVIHTSDFESQTEHVLRILGFPPVSYYTRRPNRTLDVPYHLPPFEDYMVKEVLLDDLYASILGHGVVPISQTPHYRYLMGDKESYRAYHAAHFGKELTDDHLPETFDRLIANFDNARFREGGRQSLILAVKRTGHGYQILDGVHRASILKSLAVRSVLIAEPVSNPSLHLQDVP